MHQNLTYYVCLTLRYRFACWCLKKHLAYVLFLNRGMIIYFFFTYLITLGKDVTFWLITKLSELSNCKLNTELKCGLTD